MKTLVCLLLPLPMVLFSAVLGMAEDVSVPTVNDIIDGIKASESRFFQLDSFLVNCERKRSEDITPSRFSGGYSNVVFIVAKSENRWFTSKAFTEAGQEDSEGRNMVTVKGGGQIWTPLEPQVLLLKDHLSLEWKQFTEYAFVDHFEEGHTKNVHSRFDYFRHVGWNVSRHLIESENKDYNTVRQTLFEDDIDHPFLPEFLEKNKNKYTVHPNQEDVDGFPCWVVEYPCMDKFWIDIGHGYAARKRIYHWAPGTPRKFSILNQEWKEDVPGLWLPHKQIVDKYASIVAEDSKIWDEVTARMYYEVNEILINNVPDEVFEITLPVGTQVTDNARKTQYTIYDPDHDPFAGPIQQGLKANRYVKYRAIGIIIGSILIFIAVWRLLRRMEKKTNENHCPYYSQYVLFGWWCC
jgi:hypothetical protein